MKKLTVLALFLGLSTALSACGEESDKEAADSGDTPAGESGGDESGGDESGGDESGGDASGGDASGGDASGGDESGGDLCSEEYAFCGSIAIPSDMVGTPRSMAISLYDTLTPAGPPNVTVTEIDAPAVVAGEDYLVEFSPLIATGDYYVFVFLYMEGGGEWAPEPGIDYFGHSDAMISFTGAPVAFEAIPLGMAE